jgi:hypothetical protein
MRLTRVIVSISLAIILIFLADFIPAPRFLLPPNVAPVSGPNLVYFQVRPSWGTVQVDGRKLDPLPQVNRDLPLTLTAGTHTIDWLTPPFQTLHCQLNIPLQTAHMGKNSCPVQTLTDPNAFVHIAALVTAPQMYTLRSLPQDQQDALLNVLQQRLDELTSTALVQPGERYGIADDSSAPRTVTQTLQAEQRFVLDTRGDGGTSSCSGVSLGDGCDIDGNDCHGICTVPWPGDNQYDRPQWNIGAIFHPQWTLMRPNSAATPLSIENGSQQFVTFQVAWQNSSWSAVFHPEGESTFDDPNCITMIGVVSNDARFQDTGAAHWVYVSGQNRADGCVAVLQPNAINQLAPTNGPLLLYRFGVLIAANDKAVSEWKELPAASAAERAIVERIVSHPVFTS